MATQSSSTSISVGSSNEPTIVEVLETTRNKEIWQHYDLCKISDGSKKGRCKCCGKFISASSNSTLRLHFEKPYCPVLKIVSDAGQSSMSREGGIFAYEDDRVLQQFASFVIQEGRQYQFPVLSIMARDLLSVQASTIASESAFSLNAQERIQHTSNLEGDCLEIEQQLYEVELEAGYPINIADEEIVLEEQAMSGSGDSE
ncbi:zinc finger, BED-type, phospholipase-like, homeodomain-like protein [Tanacetum coccineum]